MSIHDKFLWFDSELYKTMKESYPQITIEDCFQENNPLKLYLHDFIELKCIETNYKMYMELCDYLCVDNADILVDKIVDLYETFQIIDQFSDIYKRISKRLHPHTNETLKKAIRLWCKDKHKCYMQYGYCAYWNVSNVTNMEDLFEDLSFHDDISKWDVSNVTNMSFMFWYSHFNGDITNWDVSSVITMEGMFLNNHSFNQDLSKWNVSNVQNMNYMFWYSHFDNNISTWNVSNVSSMISMFQDSHFNGDIHTWDVSNVYHMRNMFQNSRFQQDISSWKVNNKIDIENVFSSLNQKPSIL